MSRVDPGGGGDDGLFVASKQAMNSTGSTLSIDASGLQSDMSTFWSLFDSAVGSLPACLEQTLRDYEQAHKTPYQQCVQHRLDLAQALQDSGDLTEAVDKACAAAFTDPTLANVSLTNLLSGN